MAKPNKKLPERSVKVLCRDCHSPLYHYKKGGKGALIKCFIERITRDHTSEEGICPKCHNQFAKRQLVKGVPAMVIIGNKAYQK